MNMPVLDILKDMKLTENGIGSNYKTIDNDPISHFNDPRIRVEIYPGQDQKVHANVSCEQLGYDSGLKTFDTEQAARNFAINLNDQLVSKLNALVENVLIRVLREMSQ